MNNEKAAHLVEILLPARGEGGKAVPPDRFEHVLKELTEKFGGVTSFVRAPGTGLWQSGDDIERDNIAVIEVMTDNIDADYWAGLRARLEKEFSQEEIVVRSYEMRRL